MRGKEHASVKKKMKKIVVIIPTYNERVNMEKMLPKLVEEVFPKIKNAQVEILVADDSSPDKTAEVVKDYMKKYKNISLLLGEKKGLGAAYVKAMRHAMEKMHADAVIEFDADFQHDPEDIPKLVDAYLEGNDYVIGSRYIPGGEIPKEWGLHRKLMSFFGSLFARIVLFTFHIHDMTSGLKLTASSYLSRVDLENLYSKYYAYKIQILYEVVKLGAKVKEVPIIFYERTEGSSKIARKDLFDSFWVVIRLRYRDSKRFVKFLIVGATGFITQLIFQETSIYTGLATVIAVFIDNLYYVANPVALTNAVGAGIGAEAAIIANFTFNNFWTFNDTRKMKKKLPIPIRFLRFNLSSLGAIFIQTFAVWLGVSMLGDTLLGFFPTRIAVVVPTIVLFIIPLNYLIYNKIIWKTQHLHDEKNPSA